MDCPWCGAQPIHSDDQPQPGLHGYSTKFECGAMISNAIGSNNPENEWSEDNRCGGPNESVMPSIADLLSITR